MWKYLIGENMSALLQIIARRFTSEDTPKGSAVMVIAAMTTMNFSV